MDKGEELGKVLKISRISAGNTYRKHVNIIILKEGGRFKRKCKMII